MKTWLLFSLVVLATGCAARKPLVDMKGVDEAQYKVDLAECEKYAEQAPGPGSGGVVVGGAKGAGKGAQTRRQVVAKCLSGRGYKVLN